MPLMAVMIQPRVSLSSAMVAPRALARAALFFPAMRWGLRSSEGGSQGLEAKTQMTEGSGQGER